MLKLKKQNGFTLVELLVVVVIIGILAAIALPNFIGAQGKAKAASVKGNMHTLQIASESYATDAGGVYASAVSLTGPYLPGGANALGGSAGNYPTNPVTGITNQTPAAASITSVNTARTSGPTAFGSGQISYDSVSSATSYAIAGCDSNNKVLTGAGGQYLILSNQ